HQKGSGGAVADRGAERDPIRPLKIAEGGGRNASTPIALPNAQHANLCRQMRGRLAERLRHRSQLPGVDDRDVPAHRRPLPPTDPSCPYAAVTRAAMAASASRPQERGSWDVLIPSDPARAKPCRAVFKVSDELTFTARRASSPADTLSSIAGYHSVVAVGIRPVLLVAAHDSSSLCTVISTLPRSAFETGQRDAARSSACSKPACSISGTRAWSFSSLVVTFGAPSTSSSVHAALTTSRSGGV